MRTWSLRVLRQVFRRLAGSLPGLALSTLHVYGAAVSAAFKSRATLHLENLALRHQLGVLRRSVKRPKLTSIESSGRGSVKLGAIGDLPWSSSSRKPSLPGTAKAFG